MTIPSPDRVNKLKVLWQKGRNFYSTFYVELAEARSEIGDNAAFASWCIMDLNIGLEVLNNVASILKRADADIVKRELAAARAEEKAAKAARSSADKRVRELKRAAAKQAKAAKAASAKKEKRNKQVRLGAKRRKEEKLKLYAASAPNVVTITPVNSTGALLKGIREAIAARDDSRVAWINASVKLGVCLCQARARFPSDNAFGAWLAKHEISLNDHDRAALLNLGVNETAMRRALERTQRSSYQYIWKEVQLAIGKAA